VDITERVDAEERARKYADDVRDLLNRLIATQESERRRISDDLHDLIGQNLTAAGIELSALKALLSPQSHANAMPKIEAIGSLLNSTIEAIRGVMTELRPPALEEYGLAPALRWYASVFAARTGMKATVGVSGSEARLRRETELALFRIAQEALINAAKHSGGSAVHIALGQSPEAVRLAIEDDGQGFADPIGARRARRGGWGLAGMRERAEAHGGTLRIEFPGRGTRVVVEIPRAHD